MPSSIIKPLYDGTDTQVQVENGSNNYGNDDDDSSSVDTNEAFMEMLGLSLDENENLLVKQSDNNNNGLNSFEEEIIVKPSQRVSKTLDGTIISYEHISLPSRCSRHLIAPKACLAFVMDDVLTKEQCEYLIYKAATAKNDSASKGFRYITEATHIAPDGTSYTVQIQNPNPHKLAVIDTFHHPSSMSSISSNIYSAINKPGGRKKRTRKRTYYGHEDEHATLIMNELYTKISNVLNESCNSSYQKFVQRTKCGYHQGLNPRMRVLKYDADCNDRFEPHFDATTFVSNGLYADEDGDNKVNEMKEEEKGDAIALVDTADKLQSLITVLVYLNEDFEGGETLYLDYHNSSTSNCPYTNTNTRTDTTSNEVKVTPKVGRVVLFEHDLYHSGSILTKGTKYVMRTDILYEYNEGNFDNTTTNRSSKDETNGRSKDSEEHKTQLLIHICDEMNLSNSNRAILEEIGILHSSPEAFIAPGITLLKQMLIDAGMETDFVNSLIERAVELVKS